MQVGTCLRARDVDLKKTRPVTQTLNPDAIIRLKIGKHVPRGLFLIKVQVERSANFLRIDSSTGASCGYCKNFKNSFLMQHLRWLLLTVLPWYSKASWGAYSVISRLHVHSILIKNFHETLHK